MRRSEIEDPFEDLRDLIDEPVAPRPAFADSCGRVS